MADQNTKTAKQERPNKDEIKGLPAHAQYQFRQGTWYVYWFISEVRGTRP